MKRFRKMKNKEDFYIAFIYLLVACAILANYSQLMALKYRAGNFHFGEMILILCNDSYTGYFTFPFLLGFVLMIQSPVEPNIFFAISRYPSRQAFYRKKHCKVVKNVLTYVFSICIFSMIVGFGDSTFDRGVSTAAKKYFELYFFGQLESNVLLLEIIKTILLQVLLLYFFSLLHALLTQFRIPQALVFVVYTGVQLSMAGMTLGLLGEGLRPFSLFSLAGSVYEAGGNFIGRLGILASIDAILLFLNFKIFEGKDLVLPKGSKQYQNE